jgi:3-hydroxypropanoate dehydrogenase
MIADAIETHQSIGDEALDQLFRKARTPHAWRPASVSDRLLREVWGLARMGPTATNSTPARILFVRTTEAKERLKPALRPANVEATMAAPVTAIIGGDLDFVATLPQRFPDRDAMARYVGDEAKIERTARLNATLQAAYFIMAARSLGLDCWPITGCDFTSVDRIFFPGGRIRSLLLCNLGHGDASKLTPRLPRPTFEEACSLL